MTKFIIAFFLVFSASTLFSYTAKVTVQVAPREAAISILYTLNAKYGDRYRIDLPPRIRLNGINYQNRGPVDHSRTADTIWLAAISNTNDNRIQITYSLPIRDIEFVLTNWLPVLSEDGKLTASITAPDRMRGGVIPFEQNTSDGYAFSQDDRPVLFCGKYNLLSETVEGTHIEMLYPFKAGFTGAEASAIFRSYQELLFPLRQKNLYLVQLADIPNLVKFSSDNVFVTMNAATPDELRRMLASLWFRGSIRLPEESAWALVDLYRRLVTDSGSGKPDDGNLAPVPSGEYYRGILKTGFPGKNEVECDVNSMLKNFALLHFAYYTVGRETFIARMKQAFQDYLGSPATNGNFFAAFSNAGPNPEITAWAARQLLPISAASPDLALKKITAYRSLDTIPDVQVADRVSNLSLVWGGKRGVDLTGLSGMLEIDPARLVPQLNFYDDKSWLDTGEQAEAELAFRAAGAHKHFKDESFREILDLSRFTAPEGNAFGVPAGSTVFVAVTKFYAPVRSRFVMGLKETVITVGGGKATVVSDRVRM